jgi:hypothetical protein
MNTTRNDVAWLKSVMLALMATAVFKLCSCSALVAATESRKSDELPSLHSREDVQKLMGRKLKTETFNPPILLKNDPAIRSISFIPPEKATQKVSSRENYRIPRRYVPNDGITNADGFAMLSANTAWITEPVMFPAAVLGRVVSRKGTLLCWFNAKGDLVWYYER